MAPDLGCRGSPGHGSCSPEMGAAMGGGEGAWAAAYSTGAMEMSKAVVPSSIVFEVLDGHNYVDWSEAIEAYLKAQDLWDVVESDQQPPKKQFKAIWEKKNAAALHAIKISCGTNTLPHIRGIREANEAWSRLEERFSNPPSSSNTSRNFFRLKDSDRSITDVENVDHEFRIAYKDWDDAFSNSNLSAAIELCKKYPLLLTKTLPNDRLVLNELIKLGGRDHQQNVVEILRLLVPSDDLRNCLSKRDNDNVLHIKPLEVAVRVGAIEIARFLAEMAPEILLYLDSLGLTPLAAAIGSHMKDMADMLYGLLTTQDSFWTDANATKTATVITKSFEAENLDIPLNLLKSSPEKFILTKDIYDNSPLCAAARAPNLFRRTYHSRFLPKCICKVLGPRLPLGSINFKISGIDFLICLGNAIRDPSTHSETKIDIISEAFFEAIKHENFNFILMLINFLKPIVRFTNDEYRNMYMFAIAHRRAKLFSLYFWDRRDERDLDPSLSFDKWENNLLHMVGASTPPIALDRISKPALRMKRELMWFKEVEKLVPELVRKSKNRDDKTPYELFNESHKDLIMEAVKWMKESASSWAIVGPVIITIMFAAAFQVPGGSIQDKGYPIFFEEWLFKVYMVLVAISLFSATISVLKFLEILSANYEEEDFLASLRTYNVITGTLFLSLATMLIAFCMGLFLTLHGELAIFLPIAAIATFLVCYIIFTKLPLLAESLNFFTFEEVKIPFIKWRTSIFDRNIRHEVERIFEMLNRDSQK